MPGLYNNIISATTTAVSAKSCVLKSILINKDVVSSVLTIYDNVPAGITALDADGISVSQSKASAGDLTITGAYASGGVATLGYGRNVTLTFAANETGKVFTITGIGNNGAALVEVINGTTIGTVTSVGQFYSVSQVSVASATTGALTVGVNAQSGTKIATITAPGTLLNNQVSIDYDIQCRYGLTIVTSTAQDVTVVYQ